MTGWTIEAGYQYDVQRADVATEIVNAVARIRRQHKRLSDLSGEGVGTIAEYLHPDGGAVYVHTDGDGEPRVGLLASGGGQWRPCKERIARAVCIAVMQDLHEQGMNVSVVCS